MSSYTPPYTPQSRGLCDVRNENRQAVLRGEVGEGEKKERERERRETGGQEVLSRDSESFPEQSPCHPVRVGQQRNS